MIKGYASSKKNEGAENAFVTVEPIRQEQHGMSVLSHMTLVSIGTDTSENDTEIGVIEATGHLAQKGDVIQVTSGSFSDREIKVESVEANFIYLSEKIDIGVTETFEILRHKYPRVDSSGNIQTTATLAPSAVKFNLDAVLTDVSEDTGTPGDSVPLPVKVLDANGLVPDFATEVTSAALLAELELKANLTDTQPVSVASLPLPAGAATEAKQDSAITELQDIESEVQDVEAQLVILNAVDFATEAKQDDIITELVSLNAVDFASETTLAALLAELQLKADLTETQPVSVASLPLPTGAATAANQTTIIGHVDGIEALLTSIAAEDFATETTLAALNAKFNSLGQKTMANSAPVVIASDQSNLPTKPQGGDISDAYVKVTGSVTSGAWVEVIASTAALATGLTVFDATGYAFEIGVGPAASEVRKLVVPPGGLNGLIPLRISAGSRVSIRAINTTLVHAADAPLVLNLIQ